MKIVIATLALVLTLTLFVNAEKCAKGQYFSTAGWDWSCKPCTRGYFCPGDNTAYLCKGNTYTSQTGQATCLSCPSDFPFAAPEHQFCMPPDTPLNIKQIDITKSNDGVQVFQSGFHYVMEVQFESLSELTIITFYNYSKQGLAPVISVYDSTKSGNPDPTNYEHKSIGRNVTLAVNRPVDRSLYVPVYFYFESAEPYVAVYINDAGSLTGRIILNSGTHMVQLDSIEYIDRYLFFEIPDITAKSRVAITTTVQSLNGPMQIINSIYNSDDRIEKYPTGSNYNKMSYGHSFNAEKLVTSLLLSQVEPGPLYFSVDIEEYASIPTFPSVIVTTTVQVTST